MARKAMILKQKEEPKFSTRYYNRCKICGRPHAYLRDYGKTLPDEKIFTNLPSED